jgi:carboxymethylenebutenolidase
MATKTEYVTLSVSDGTSMRAYISRPASAPRAGLIVFQEAFGVNAHIRDVADRFAREGFLCIAPELFHRTAPGLEAGYTNFAEVAPHMQAMTNGGLEADIRAAHGWMEENAKGLSISATGYCMGGRTACLAAMIVPLACGISYYGGGIAPGGMFPSLIDRINEIGAPMLFFWGGLDQHIGSDAVKAVNDALRAEKKTWINAEFSFADHGFFCDARASYNAEAAAEAWSLTLTFLNSHIS